MINILGRYRYQPAEDVIALELQIQQLIQGVEAFVRNDNEKPTARGAMQALLGFAQVLMGYVKAAVADVAEQATSDYRVGLAVEDVDDLRARQSVTVECICAAINELDCEGSTAKACEMLQDALVQAEGVLLELEQLAVEEVDEDEDAEEADTKEPGPTGPRLVL